MVNRAKLNLGVVEVVDVERLESEIPAAPLELIPEVARRHAMASGHDVPGLEDAGPQVGRGDVGAGIRRHDAVERDEPALRRDDRFLATQRACGYQRADRLSHHALAPLAPVIHRGVDDVREVAFGTWLPVGRSLHVEAKIRKFRCERRRDEHRVLLRVGEELLGQPVLVMSRLDTKRRDAGADPADAVLPVGRVVNGRRAACGGEET